MITNIIEVVDIPDDLLIQFFFSFPFRLPVVVMWKECECIVIPAQHVSIKFESETSFDVVLSVAMQIMQLVDVSEKKVHQ